MIYLGRITEIIAKVIGVLGTIGSLYLAVKCGKLQASGEIMDLPISPVGVFVVCILGVAILVLILLALAQILDYLHDIFAEVHEIKRKVENEK